MSYPFTLNRQVEFHDPAMEIHAFPIEPILLTGSLPARTRKEIAARLGKTLVEVLKR